MLEDSVHASDDSVPHFETIYSDNEERNNSITDENLHVNRNAETYALVRATGRQTARSKRGTIDFVRDASSWLFGTATVRQVNEIRKLLTQVKIGADAARMRDSTSKFQKLENKRMDDLHAVIDMENIALGNVRVHIDDIQRSLDFEIDIVTYMLD